jgi:exosortase
MTTQKILEIRGLAARHHVCFLLLGVLSLMVLWAPLTMVLMLSLHQETYSHTLIVPLISAALVYLERRTVFRAPKFSPLKSAPFLLAGVIAWWASRSASLDQNVRLSLFVCALIATWIAWFVLSYGTQCFHAALFPLLFLLLMIPLPLVVIDKIILVLQKGSAAVAYGLFRALGVPVFSSGLKFALPGVEVEVAKDCSGIRSGISLLITGIVAGHVFLKSSWTKILLSVLTVPIAIFKNAVRIVIISCLGVYVDRSFLFGNLHRYGGVPFALIALAILGPVLLILRRAETPNRKDQQREMRNQKAGTSWIASQLS